MTDPHTNRWRGTLEEAIKHAGEAGGMLSVSHVLANPEGDFSVLSKL